MAISSVSNAAPIKPVTPLAASTPKTEAAASSAAPSSSTSAPPKPVTNGLGQTIGQSLNTKA